MEYPGNPINLTKDQIIRHYARSGFKPHKKTTMNAMVREQYLQLRETHAFYVDLVERGVIKDDGGADVIQQTIETLEVYIKKLDAYDYS